MKILKVLVLGATGRIGSVLRRSWMQENTADGVIWQARRPQAGPGWHVFDPLSGQEAAAGSGALMQAAQGCDRILCLAGAIPGRQQDLADNTRLARAAILAGAEVGAGVLLCSSVAVYGAQDGVLDEASALRPVAPYGQAKLEMEQAGQALGQQLGVAVTALRIANVAGCDAILGGWAPGFALDRFADGTTPRRSYIGPQTLARVLWDLTQARDLPPVLNVAAPGAVEMGALLDAAGLAWTPRPAPPEAIARVEVATEALSAFTRLEARDSLPEHLIAQWRSSAA